MLRVMMLCAMIGCVPAFWGTYSIFMVQDGGSRLLKNISYNLPDYMVS